MYKSKLEISGFIIIGTIIGLITSLLIVGTLVSSVDHTLQSQYFFNMFPYFFVVLSSVISAAFIVLD